MYETTLAEPTARVGEVGAAEWDLDQAKAACETEIAAALWAPGSRLKRPWRRQANLASSRTEFPEDSEPAPPTADPQPSRLLKRIRRPELCHYQSQ